MRLWIEAGRVTVKTQSIQPPVERLKRRRKPEKSEEPEEKRRMKSTSQEEKSENLGCGNLSSGLPQGNYLKWLIVFFCLSLVAFAVGFAIEACCQRLQLAFPPSQPGGNQRFILPDCPAKAMGEPLGSGSVGRLAQTIVGRLHVPTRPKLFVPNKAVEEG